MGRAGRTSRADGRESRRFGRAAAGFFGACALVALAGVLVVAHLRREDAARTYLRLAAERMVLQDPRVIAHGGRPTGASVQRSQALRDGGIEYRVHLSGRHPCMRGCVQRSRAPTRSCR